MSDLVIFTNPITGRVEQMPVAMIGAYVAHAEHLHLEEAAKVAAIRDDEAAANLELSCVEEPILSINAPEFVPA